MNRSRPSFMLASTLSLVCAVACQHLGPPTAAAHAVLDAASVAEGAERTQYHVRSADKNQSNWDHVTIAPEFWEPAIAQLHPLRLWEDAGNIVIVLTEDDQGQAGLYACPAASSRGPDSNSQTQFERIWSSDDPTLSIYGTLYRYRSSDRTWGAIAPAGIPRTPAAPPTSHPSIPQSRNSMIQ